MANLGTGIISSVGSSAGIDLLPQTQVPLKGEKNFFQVSMADKQLKVIPIEDKDLGRRASLLDPAITNRFKAR